MADTAQTTGKLEIVSFNILLKGRDEPQALTPSEEVELPEDSHYKLRITFKVSDDLVSGLKAVSTLYRKGIKVSTDKNMLGSFVPQIAPSEVSLPRNGWEQAPSGVIARGSYTAKLALVDDDGTKQAELEWAFKIVQ
ncbi:hypothetical protein ACIQNU_43250 [Streptomyces sp. NPDC091292]|uniref:hypothetical protein n=1 Tax=Streptomyces sp. NPDC091292 TaxID=3365991 RepID=UPI00382FA24A